MVNKPLHVSVGLRPGHAVAGAFGNLLMAVRASAGSVAFSFPVPVSGARSGKHTRHRL